MVDSIDKKSYSAALLFEGRNRGNRFLNDLEDHLSKVKWRNDTQYDRVPGILSYKEQTTAFSLSPKSLAQYSGYVTAFTYDKRARFVNNVADGIEALKKGNLL